MTEERLNLMAIAVFLMTLSAFFLPILHISPFWPAAATLGLLGLVTVDSLTWESRGLTLLLERFAGSDHRQRVLHHEAGHFLVAALLDIPVTDYSLSAWEAWQKGQPGSGGVQFDLAIIQQRLQNPQELALTLERLATVWMAGIAAETLIYGKAEGGESDRQAIRYAFRLAGLPPTVYSQKESWGLLQAKNLLEKQQKCYESLVQAMEKRASVASCHQILEECRLSAP